MSKLLPMNSDIKIERALYQERILVLNTTNSRLLYSKPQDTQLDYETATTVSSYSLH